MVKYLVKSRRDQLIHGKRQYFMGAFWNIQIHGEIFKQVGQLIADGPRDVHVIITLYRH